jgi:hypothetical protein
VAAAGVAAAHPSPAGFTRAFTASAIAALVAAVIAGLVAPPGHAAPGATPMAH